jgi:hypothetical protein
MSAIATSPGPGVTGGSISGVGAAWPMTRADRSRNETLGWPVNEQREEDRFLKMSGV